MRIESGRIRRWRSPLREPYRIASGCFAELTNVLLEVRFADGTRGYGCAAPAPEVTGEAPADTEAALQEALGRAAGRSVAAAPGELDAVGRVVEELLPAARARRVPAARCALECALLDALARAAGVSMARWLGGYPRPLATSVTIGACPPDETLTRAAALVAEGFRALKIKGGIDVDEDIVRLRLLREHLGEGVALRFDANAGYSREQAIRWSHGTADLGIECLEQPLPRAHDEQLPGLRRELRRGVGRRAPLLMADESLHGLADARRLAAAGAVDAFNVKLMKCGGVGPARALLAFAAARGVAVMLSCMDELALAIAAPLHLALATSPPPLLDLDGHLDVVDDPSAGAVRLQRGELWVADTPGLGCSPAIF